MNPKKTERRPGRPLLHFATPADGIDVGGKRLFPGWDWTWRRGQHWGVVGPNGCGKSVLVRLLCGDLFAPEASFELAGPEDDPARVFSVVSLERQARLLRSMDAYVQMRWSASEEEATPTLGSWLSQDAVEGIAPFERVERSAADEAAFARRRARIVSRMGLAALLGRHLVSLSNGEMRRAMLARALLAASPVLALDAPFVGLDAESRAILADTLSALTGRPSPAVLVATQRPEDLPPGITHLLELDRSGRVVRSGPVRRFKGPTSSTSSTSSTPAPPAPRPAGPTAWVASGTPGTGPAIVRMHSATVSYGDRIVFENLDWTVRRGERWLLEGPNGSGKSTLLALVIGDHPQAYANDVRIFGRRRGTGDSIWDVKKRIGWVSPELHACMDPGATALDTVLSGFTDTPLFHGAPGARRRRAALAALARFGMDGAAGERFGALSAGEGRLVLLARAVVKNPPLLVLDEPCQNLDAANRRRFVSFVDAFCADRPDATLLYVTHRADSVPRCIGLRLRATPVRVRP